MADKTSLILHYTDPLAKNGTTSITYVNPNADDAKLKTLTQMLNNLTINTYVSTDKVETTDITNAVSKTTPTFTIGDATGTLQSGKVISYTYNGDGEVYLRIPDTGNTLTYKLNSTEKTVTVYGVQMGQRVTLNLYATGTETYLEATTSKSFDFMN